VKGTAIVLMYHNIGKPPKSALLKSLYVTPFMFGLQMTYLKKAGFSVVSLDEVLNFTSGKSGRDKLVALTFDDGYQDFYENAYPVLKASKFPATVFLVSDLVGTENAWDRDSVKAVKKLMSWETVRKLTREGITFGSHTKTHPFLSRLAADKMEEEIFVSKSHIENKLQLPIESICYPYGDYNGNVIETAKRAGYKIALTVNRGLVHPNDDAFEIRRSFIRLNTHPLLFMYKLHSGYEDRRGKRK
jgi:peptidoglycan/xylan/chitin deacetylase (PgdA/CDA1 family)